VTPEAAPTPMVGSEPVAAPTSAPPPAAGARKGPGLRASVRELLGARDLIGSLVRRDLQTRHRGTVLGMLWSFATPLMLVGLYSFVFLLVFKASPAVDLARPDGANVPFPVYFFCGLTLWNLFNTSVAGAAWSVLGASYLLSKVYFPRAILPLSTVLAALITFGFELLVLIAVILVFVGPPSVHVLWVPVIVGIVLVMAFGLALLVSAVTVFLRDVAHFIGIFMQLWFWGTPVIYSLQFVGDRPALQTLLKLNPMTGPIVSFRNVVLLNHPPAFRILAYDLVVAFAILWLGAWVFNRCQRMFPEMI
jgi:lipopolysaccharide transport system permease protein